MTTPPATAVVGVRRLRVAAAIAGLAIAACFLWFALFPLAWVAFAPLIWAVRLSPTSRETTVIGLIAGMCTNVPAFYWLVYTINVFGGFPYPLAVLLYLGLSLFASLQFVIFVHVIRRLGPGLLSLSAPVVWVGLEFVFPNLFPWRMANSQFHAPWLIQIGDLTGPFALSFAILWVSAGFVDAATSPHRKLPLVTATLLAVAIAGYGAWRLPQIDAAIAAAPTFRVGLVQGNISIEEKGDRTYFDVNLERYAALSEPIQDEVDLLIWPETVSQHWTPADASFLDAGAHPFPGARVPLFFGGLAYRMTGPRQADEFNSAFLVAADGRVMDRYDKRILMPFGEFIPGATYFPWIKKLSPATASFKAGQDVKVFALAEGLQLGALICYEDIVDDMPRATTNAGAEVLATILNDAWYGYSPAAHQHQALALWRTVENRRYLLRGSNTGVTSIIDAAGRVVDEGGLFTEEVIVGEVARLQIPTVYGRVGNAFAWTVTFVAGVWFLVARFSARRGP